MLDLEPELQPVEKSIKVGAAWKGLSILEAVRKAFPELTPREIFKEARSGLLLLNGKKTLPTAALNEGDLLKVTLLRPKALEVKPVQRSNEWVQTPAGPLYIVHEDEDLLAVAKAAGCASHPALGRSQVTLIDRVLKALGSKDSDEFKPALANRLDIETSGIVLIGKNKVARARLGLTLQARLIEKRYLALVEGFTPEKGEITIPLDKKPDSRALARCSPGDRALEEKIQEAHTRYSLVSRSKNLVAASLVEVELLTGRNHQIRRHFKAIGHPVALDKRYGDREFNKILGGETGLDRMFLHAYLVRLPHPATRNIIELKAPLPEDLALPAGKLGIEIPPEGL